jgi:hypothetical protein
MPKTFSETIAETTHGEIDDLATKEMATLVTEMLQAERTIGGKQKGTITLKLAFSLERGVFDTSAEVTVKRPARVKPRAFLFAGKDGSLSEEDTRQGSLDLKANARDVSTATAGKVRDITDARSAAANDRG